jgi:hypothetical protein
MAAFVLDDGIFQQFTNEVRSKQYQRIWSHFVDFCGDFDLEAGQPGEELLTNLTGWNGEGVGFLNCCDEKGCVVGYSDYDVFFRK